MLLGILIFSAYPAVTLNREHIQVDLFGELFKRAPRVNKVRLFLIDIVSLVGVIVIGLRLWERAQRALLRGTSSETMEWPVWPVVYLMAILLAATVLLFSARIIIDLVSGFRTEGDKHV